MENHILWWNLLASMDFSKVKNLFDLIKLKSLVDIYVKALLTGQLIGRDLVGIVTDSGFKV